MENRLIPISQIKPHPRNYNVHPAGQLQDLQASYRRFSQYRSIVVWQRSPDLYITVAGHGIVEAMRRDGSYLVRADILPTDTPEHEIDAILAADNELARKSQGDEYKLAEILEEQRLAGADLSSLGTSEEDLNQLLQKLADEQLRAAGPVDPGADEDDEQSPAADRELYEPIGGKVKSAFGVLVECESEIEQQRAYELASSEGFACRVVTL